VSTLWSISDFATALLMSRFYELLAQQLEEQPGMALREAQHWLRELTIEQAEAYIATHPLLREHQAARGEGLRAGSEVATARPFSEVTTWGAFVFSGA
jgi:CHAT domain-containing protein